MFAAFGGGNKGDIGSVTKNAGNDAEKQKACSAAVEQWWLELQHQLEAESNRKEDAPINGNSKSFLLETTDALQPLLDIAFFRYWDMDHARENGERYITVEQSHRLLNDLLRTNEGAAITAIKDYMKYKMVSGGKDNEGVSVKKKELVETRVKAAMDKFDLAAAVGNKDISVEDLEAAITKAKEAKLTEEEIKGAEGTLTQAKAAKEKKTNYAQDAANKEIERKAKEDDKAKEKDAKDGNDEATKKVANTRTTDEAAKKTKDDKAAADKAEADNTAAEEAAQERKKAEEDATKAVEVFFDERYNTAVDETVAEMETAFSKKKFCNRQKASTKFFESTTSKAADGPTITQNELNKIMHLGECEKFDALCTELGFDANSFDAALGKLKLEDEAAKE